MEEVFVMNGLKWLVAVLVGAGFLMVVISVVCLIVGVYVALQPM